MQQAEARVEAMLKALRTVECALELIDHWKETMPERLRLIVQDAISEEERMRIVDATES